MTVESILAKYCVTKTPTFKGHLHKLHVICCSTSAQIIVGDRSVGSMPLRRALP